MDEAEAAVNGFQMRHGDAVLTEVQQLEQQLRDVNEGWRGPVASSSWLRPISRQLPL